MLLDGRSMASTNSSPTRALPDPAPNQPLTPILSTPTKTTRLLPPPAVLIRCGLNGAAATSLKKKAGQIVTVDWSSSPARMAPSSLWAAAT